MRQWPVVLTLRLSTLELQLQLLAYLLTAEVVFHPTGAAGVCFSFLNCLTLLGVCGPPNQGEHNRGSVDLLRGRPPSGPASTALSRLRLCRGSAPCVRSLPSPRLGLAFRLPHKPHTSGGLAALRVPVGEGDSRDISGVCL